MNFTKIVAVFPILFTLSACGSSGDSATNGTASASLSCASNQAIIQVGDSFLKRVCGCKEAQNTLFSAGTGSLVCSVGSGSTVLFIFDGALNSHQILSTGTPSFPSTPLYSPSQSTTFSSFPVTLTTLGTYTFQDPFVTGESGSITVQ